MSDIDTLIAAFQTQLSDVMETILKTAMYEVTKLVEDGLLEQLKSRSHEVESLKVQLQLTEKKLSDEDYMITTNEECHFNRGKTLNTSPYGAEDGLNTLHSGSGVTEECGLKQEILFLDHRIRSCGQEVITNLGTTQVAEKLTHSLCLLRDSQAMEEAIEKPAVVVKVEDDVKPSCSIEHQEGLAVYAKHQGTDLFSNATGVTGSTIHSLDQMTDFQSKQTQSCSEELSGTTMSQNGHSSPNAFTEDQEDLVSPLDMDSKRGGLSLLQNHTLSAANDSDPPLVSDSTQQIGHELMELVSSEARVQISHVGDVVIKQEILLDTDEDEEVLLVKQATDSAIAFSSCQVKNRKVRLDVPGHNYVSHRAKMQEVTKRHFKTGTSLALQAAVRHHRPIRETHHTLSSNAITGHSLAASLNIHNRTPSTFKSVPSPSSAQPATLGDKQVIADSQNCLPMASIKAHYPAQSSQHPNSHTYPGSTTQGPRNRCGQCGRCFADPRNLRSHMLTHTGERPFICSLCGRSFTKLSNLKAHRRVHTGERPYCCMACGKGFTQKCNLKRHQRLHLNV